MKEYIVYQAKNKINGNSYIGATSCGLKVRKYKHFQDSKASRPGCKVFNSAIRKYGENAFEWSILKICESFDHMMDEEVRLISELSPEYNCTRGGQGMIGLIRTPEWLEKTSKALKGRKLPEWQVELLRNVDRSFSYKSVVCLQDGKFFESIKSASEFYNIRKKSIGEVLSGRQVHTKGLSFVYSKCPLSNIEIKKNLELNKKRLDDWNQRRNKDKRKPILCSNGIIYESARKASSELNISPVRIMQICQGGGKTKSGLSFSYYL